MDSNRPSPLHARHSERSNNKGNKRALEDAIIISPSVRCSKRTKSTKISSCNEISSDVEQDGRQTERSPANETIKQETESINIKSAPKKRHPAHLVSHGEFDVENSELNSSENKVKTEVDTHIVEADQIGRKKAKKKSTKPEAVVKEEDLATIISPKKLKGKKKVNPDDEADGEGEVQVAKEEVDTSPPKVKRHRKTKEEKEAEAMPLAARTLAPKVFVGAHVSAAGGVHNCINNAIHIGGNAFALFLKSQRKWDNPALKDDQCDSFKELCVTHKYQSREHVVPHGSYLVNLAQKDETKAIQAYTSFLDDLQRCEKLGIKLYNFHPGSTGGEPRQSAIARIAERLNTAHKATSTVVTLLENMAASPEGNTIGGCFEDLRDVISLVDDKSRVGVCFDTCHGFAAGYDLCSPEAFKSTFDQFDSIIGPQYLRAVHLNDSKAPFNSHRDLHYNIGYGFLGLRAFHNLVNDTRFHGIPLVLETPCEGKNAEGKTIEDAGVWATEIKLLENLVGMDAESEEFKKMEKDLWEKGTKERKRLQEVHDRKSKEKVKKAAKGKGKRKSEVDSDMGGSESE